MYLLDTDVLIDIQRGHSPAVAWFNALTELPMVPGFVVMELLQDARNAKQVRDALKLVAPLAIVWPTELDCNRALSDFAGNHLAQGLGLISKQKAVIRDQRSEIRGQRSEVGREPKTPPTTGKTFTIGV